MKEHDIGDRVWFSVRRFKTKIVLTGEVKEKRKNFGWTEYKLEKITADEPIWVRTPKHAK